MLHRVLAWSEINRQDAKNAKKQSRKSICLFQRAKFFAGFSSWRTWLMAVQFS
jgi:hypothetical protein